MKVTGRPSQRTLRPVASSTTYANAMASAAAQENSYMFAHGTRCTARPRHTTPAACRPKAMKVASTAKRPTASARSESPATVGSASSWAVRVSTETPDEPTDTVACSRAAAEASAAAAPDRPTADAFAPIREREPKAHSPQYAKNATA